MNFYKLDWKILRDELKADVFVVVFLLVLGLFKLTLGVMTK